VLLASNAIQRETRSQVLRRENYSLGWGSTAKGKMCALDFSTAVYYVHMAT